MVPAAKNPASTYLHIRNLMRPFGISQLRTLLAQTGNVVDMVLCHQLLMSQAYVWVSVAYTVEPLLRGYSGKRPSPLKRPLDNLNINVLISASDKRLPLFKGHISGGKKVTSQEGFHCIEESSRFYLWKCSDRSRNINVGTHLHLFNIISGIKGVGDLCQCQTGMSQNKQSQSKESRSTCQ